MIRTVLPKDELRHRRSVERRVYGALRDGPASRDTIRARLPDWVTRDDLAAALRRMTASGELICDEQTPGLPWLWRIDLDRQPVTREQLDRRRWTPA
jgi:hypothetical protein